jgi:hypothetical protein
MIAAVGVMFATKLISSEGTSARTPADMCNEPRAVALASSLIKNQYPSPANLGPTLDQLRKMDEQRTGGLPKQLQNVKGQLEFFRKLDATQPRKDWKDEIRKYEAREMEITAQLEAEKNQKNDPVAPLPDNEITLDGEPYPIEYDRDLERVACRVQYRITGAARETINFLNGNVLSTAVYTVQPGRNNWIVEIIAKSD